MKIKSNNKNSSALTIPILNLSEKMKLISQNDLILNQSFYIICIYLFCHLVL